MQVASHGGSFDTGPAVLALDELSGPWMFLLPKSFLQSKLLPHSLTRHSLLQQVPPLTPSTNKKINESLKETYATWGKDSERLQVPRDPQSWSKEHVGHWLSWAIREFNLTGLTGQFEQFRVSVTHNIHTHR